MNDHDLQAERRAKRFWVSLVVGLLGLQLVVGGVAISLATNDPSVAVIPNYHAAALDWDATKRTRNAVARRGWKAELTVAEVADGRGRRAIQLRVFDQTGRPGEGLRVAGRYYRHARAGDVASLELPDVGDGQYLTLVPMAEAGLWQVDLQLEGGPEAMQVTTTVECPAADPRMADEATGA
jgi:nitrogen fixation protein FixH